MLVQLIPSIKLHTAHRTYVGSRFSEVHILNVAEYVMIHAKWFAAHSTRVRSCARYRGFCSDVSVEEGGIAGI